MDYIEITCTYTANSNTVEVSEIIIALLADLGFESFAESENAVKAYIPDVNFNAAALMELVEAYPELFRSVDTRCIKPENWNHLWESNFPMAEIAGRIVVYAPFHTDIPELEYRISIMPQMSFGTGHHETTSLMLEMMLDLDISGKRVLDMGCGTGILAIFAAMKQARTVLAIDIDQWAHLNAAENCQRNNIHSVEILQGGCSLLSGLSFDLILSNINRNVLLADFPAYAQCLAKDGILQVSGFYKEDFPEIIAEAKHNGLRMTEHLEKNNWIAAWFREK